MSQIRSHTSQASAQAHVMLGALVAVLFTLARCDWVEISQQNYQTSSHPTKHYFNEDKKNDASEVSFFNRSSFIKHKGSVLRINEADRFSSKSTQKPDQIIYKDSRVYSSLHNSDKYKPRDSGIPKFITKNIKTVSETGDFEEVTQFNSQAEIPTQISSESLHEDNATSELPLTSTEPSDHKERESGQSMGQKGSMNGLMKFLRLVSETIARNTNKGIASKARYLQRLQNSLLAAIESQIEAAWPAEGQARSKRGGRSEHVDFPSSEGALITISFLTFAVFLIKLLLQVIERYKNQSMAMAPAMVSAVGRAASALSAHHAHHDHK